MEENDNNDLNYQQIEKDIMKQYEYLKKIASNYKINIKLKDNRKIILKERNIIKK